jgi:TatD DNase family protein
MGWPDAYTFECALRIRRLATQFPIEALVLETDAPDVPPAWPGEPAARNEPGQVARIAEVLAELRSVAREHIVHATAANARWVWLRLEGALHAVS